MHAPVSTAAILALAMTFAVATPSAAHAPGNACSLLTDAQVGAALGAAVQPGRALTATLCVWRDANTNSPKKVTLVLLTANMYAMGKTPVTGTEKPALSGVGDEAYYKYFSAPRYERIKVVDLDVKKGDAMFGVSVWGLAADDAKTRAKTLAQDVIARL